MHLLSPGSLFRPLLALTLITLLGGASACRGEVKSGDVIDSEEGKFRYEVVAEGLTQPWSMVKLPDGRLLVTEKKGDLRIIQDGKLLEEKVQNVPKVRDANQGGLLDLELHPDYAKNGWIYISFSDPSEDGKTSHTRVIRAKLNGLALEDIQDIFKAPADQYTGTAHHYGSRLEFDKDNYLYISIGERGDQNKAQDLKYVQGKVHRVKDDGAIPDDNPFVKTEGAIPSIWSLGHRNPQGLRFQPGTGKLWETEHGPKGGDELNVIRKGANYGWPLICWGVNYDGTPVSDKQEAPGLEQPVTYWVPSIAPSGFDFYNGDKFPKWKGNIFVGALAHQKLVRVVVDGETATHKEILLEHTGRMRDVLCLDDGFLYIVYDNPGRIARLVPVE